MFLSAHYKATCFGHKAVVFRPLRHIEIELQLKVYFCMVRLRSQLLCVTMYCTCRNNFSIDFVVGTCIPLTLSDKKTGTVRIT